MRLILTYNSNFTATRMKAFEPLLSLLVQVKLKNKEELDEVYIHALVKAEGIVILRPMSGGEDLFVKVHDIKEVVVY